MFFVQVCHGNSGLNESVGIGSAIQLSHTIINANMCGAREGCRVRSAVIGDGMRVVVLTHGGASSTRGAVLNSGVVGGSFSGGSSAMGGGALGAGCASSFSSSDALRNASTTAVSGGGRTSGWATGDAQARLGEARLEGSGGGVSSVAGMQGRRSGLGDGLRQGAGQVNSTQETDGTLLDDPLEHWASLGHCGSLSVRLSSLRYSRVADFIYSGGDDFDEGRARSQSWTTYVHKAFSTLATEVYSCSDAFEAHGDGSLGNGGGCDGAAEDDVFVDQYYEFASTATYICVGSDIGYSDTTLVRIAALVGDIATFVNYPASSRNGYYLRTALLYIRKLAMERDVSFLGEARTYSGKCESSGFETDMTSVLEAFRSRSSTGDEDSRGQRAAELQYPAYCVVMFGDGVVVETSPGFAARALEANGHARSSSVLNAMVRSVTWGVEGRDASAERSVKAVGARGSICGRDRYIVQLLTAAFHAVPSLTAGYVTPLEWRIGKLEEGLSKFGITRHNIVSRASGLLVRRFIGMLSRSKVCGECGACEVHKSCALPPMELGKSAESATEVPQQAKSPEPEEAHRITTLYRELLALSDAMGVVERDMDSQTDAGCNGEEPPRSTSSEAVPIGGCDCDPVARESARGDDTQCRWSGSAAPVIDVCENDGARVSRVRELDALSGRPGGYHDACRFVRAVQLEETQSWSPHIPGLTRAQTPICCQIDDIMLQGAEEACAKLQIDWQLGPSDDSSDGMNAPQGFGLAFLYTGEQQAAVEDEDCVDGLQLLSDEVMDAVCEGILDRCDPSFHRAQWLTAPMVVSFAIPGLVDFLCIQRRQNVATVGNFQAGLQNGVLGERRWCRLLQDTMAINVSRAHEMLASGYSEGLWGHGGVQFFFSVTVMPSKAAMEHANRGIIADTRMSDVRARTSGLADFDVSRSGSRSQSGSKLRCDVEISPSMASSGGRPSLHSSDSMLVFERVKLPMESLGRLLYQPCMIGDECGTPLLEVYGLFAGSMSPAEVCEAAEHLIVKLYL